ncbi:MAG: hypothetical protein KAS32_24865 [Candidatus Peribacteraceae bacterium]|nr:hypothetical protein [Candidatus Peribacteraceae bacterium]
MPKFDIMAIGIEHAVHEIYEHERDLVITCTDMFMSLHKLDVRCDSQMMRDSVAMPNPGTFTAWNADISAKPLYVCTRLNAGMPLESVPSAMELMV